MMTSGDLGPPGSMANPYSNSRGVRVGKVTAPNPNAPFYMKDAIRLAGLNQQPWMRASASRRLKPVSTAFGLRQVAALGGYDLSRTRGLANTPRAGWSVVMPSSLSVRLNKRLSARPMGGSARPSGTGWPVKYPMSVRLRAR